MINHLKRLFFIGLACCCLQAVIDQETGLRVIDRGSYTRANVAGTGTDLIIRGDVASPVLRANTWIHGDTSSTLNAYEYIKDGETLLFIRRLDTLTYPHVEAKPATDADWRDVLWKETRTLTVTKPEAIRCSDNPLPHKARSSEGTPFDLATIRYDVLLSVLHWWNPVTRAPEVVLEQFLSRARTQVSVWARKSSGHPWYSRGQGEDCLAPANPGEELARFRALFPGAAALLQ